MPDRSNERAFAAAFGAATCMALWAAHAGDARGSTADAYRGLAAWVDVYDPEPRGRPERSMRAYARRGVTTVFVQTSNYRRQQPIRRPSALSRLLRAADRPTAGEGRVYRHARDALRSIRAKTGDRSVSVHMIGGIASHASVAEVRGFARAALDFDAAGASLYDAPITRPGQWRRMARVTRLKTRVA